MREDSIHRGQLLAQLPRLVDAMLADPAGLDRTLDEVAPVRGVPEENEGMDVGDRWDCQE